MLKLKSQLEDAKQTVVKAAGDTQKVTLAALGVSVLALLVAIAALLFATRGKA